MANTHVVIRRVEFIINNDLTHCNVFYESSEPGTLHMGGGWKTKAFPKDVAIVSEATAKEVANFMLWHEGRTHLDGIKIV